MQYPITFVDMESARLVRKAYIDSLISSMIRLETDPHVVVWINRLKDCRHHEWDDEVRDTIRNAILTYNNRWTFMYGGGFFDKLGNVASKYGSKVWKGVEAGLTDKPAQGTTGNIAKSVVQRLTGSPGSQTGGASDDSLREALNAELQRLQSYSRKLGPSL